MVRPLRELGHVAVIGDMWVMMGEDGAGERLDL
jgi:hypothetical protein